METQNSERHGDSEDDDRDAAALSQRVCDACGLWSPLLLCKVREEEERHVAILQVHRKELLAREASEFRRSIERCAKHLSLRWPLNDWDIQIEFSIVQRAEPLFLLVLLQTIRDLRDQGACAFCYGVGDGTELRESLAKCDALDAFTLGSEAASPRDDWETIPCDGLASDADASDQETRIMIRDLRDRIERRRDRWLAIGGPSRPTPEGP